MESQCSVPVCCNNCYTFFMGPQNCQTFFITNCYHVLCSSCIKPKEKYCVICKITCDIIELGTNVPADVKSLFNPETIYNLLDQIVKIHTFQENQHKAAIQAEENKQLTAKLIKATEYCNILKKQCDKFQKRIEIEEELIAKLEDAQL